MYFRFELCTPPSPLSHIKRIKMSTNAEKMYFQLFWSLQKSCSYHYPVMQFFSPWGGNRKIGNISTGGASIAKILYLEKKLRIECHIGRVFCLMFGGRGIEGVDSKIRFKYMFYTYTKTHLGAFQSSFLKSWSFVMSNLLCWDTVYT